MIIAMRGCNRVWIQANKFWIMTNNHRFRITRMWRALISNFLRTLILSPVVRCSKKTPLAIMAHLSILIVQWRSKIIIWFHLVSNSQLAQWLDGISNQTLRKKWLMMISFCQARRLRRSVLFSFWWWRLEILR